MLPLYVTFHLTLITAATVTVPNEPIRSWYNGGLWPAGAMGGVATWTSRVQLPAVPLSGNNPRQVVHTHVPLPSSSIIRYRSKGDDALRLGR